MRDKKLADPFIERAFVADQGRLRARGYSFSPENRALNRRQKSEVTPVSRRKRAKAIYQAYIRATLNGTPLSVVADRFGLTEAGVARIARDRACWIDIKTAAEVEAVLLVQVNQLVARADDLSASLDNELNVIEKLNEYDADVKVCIIIPTEPLDGQYPEIDIAQSDDIVMLLPKDNPQGEQANPT